MPPAGALFPDPGREATGPVCGAIGMSETSVVARMQTQVARWGDPADNRRIFLHCYLMMTQNMVTAVQGRAFRDAAWVDALLHRFADYYFVALDAYEQDPATAPRVWQQAHGATRDHRVLPLQLLLLGVNAHINYDLVLTLVDLLRPEWERLPPGRRRERYADHCQVNRIIAQTIDAVQDEVLGLASPELVRLDRALGRVDEQLIARLITRWRERVWRRATGLLESSDPGRQAAQVARVEAEALRLGRLIGRRDLMLFRQARRPTGDGS